MLSKEEIQEIEAEASHYPEKRAACITALKTVQAHRGWVSDEAIQDIAAFLEMTPDELDGVATFYNLIYREPVGEHVILLCNSVTCWILGYDSLREHLQESIGAAPGQTTPDGQFTVLPIACLGTCDHAPAIMVDDQLFQDMDPQKLDELLRDYSSEQAEWKNR